MHHYHKLLAKHLHRFQHHLSNDVTMFNKLTMMKRQIKTIQKNLDTSYIDEVYIPK